MAGIDKHKWSWAMKNVPEYFGKHGFMRPAGARKARDTIPVVHLFEINQQAVNSRLEKKEGRFRFEFKGKVLATGNVTVPLSIKAGSWSRNVEKKVGDAGGEISKLEAAKPGAAKAS
jgi:large subunit ribosomal protein L15